MTTRFPSEYKEKKLTDEVTKILGHTGRLVGGSKSTYKDNNPGNVVVFNSNLCTEESGKIWYGDLDLTKDYPLLKKLAKKLGMNLYVLYEMAARFDKEEEYDLREAILKVTPKGEVILKDIEYHYLAGEAPTFDYVQLAQDIAERELHRPKTTGTQKQSDYKELDISDFYGLLKRSRGGFNPIDGFNETLIAAFGGREKAMKAFGDLYISNRLNDLLLDKLASHIEKECGVSRKKAERDACWATFNLPSTFHEDFLPDWIRDDRVYIKKGKK